MRFVPLPLSGAFVIDIEPMEDTRGFFARTWCRDEFRAAGLASDFAQCSISFTAHRATLRGMHYQIAPDAECKLVRCTSGAVYDVVIDLRRHSPTYCAWHATELNAANRRMLYVPQGLAHGIETLEDNTEVFYQITVPYRAGAAAGVRWNDPAFDVVWPLPPAVISERDRTYPDFVR